MRMINWRGRAALLLAAVATGLMAVGCDNSSNGDGVEASVVVGKWMKNNLNIETADSWCYNDNPVNCDKYGRLYTWEAAKAACQSIGKRLPTWDDWIDLQTAVGGQNVMGRKLKATSGWNNRSDGGSGNGTNDYGFSALPGGYRGLHGGFNNAGNGGYWWRDMGAGESIEDSNGDRNYAYRESMDASHDFVGEDFNHKHDGLSVRCVEQ
jgi:uncharacterized protein (TIGR02145 family)